MKHIAPYIFILFVLFTAVPSAQAGFWVKTAHSISATSNNNNPLPAFNNPAPAEQVSNIPGPGRYYRRSYRQSEWVGIAAIVCGLLGLLVPGVNFLAILLGVLGLGRGAKVRGLAIAGFVLGVLELILFLIAGATFASYILL